MSRFDEQMPEATPAYGRPEALADAQPIQEPARLGPAQRFIGALFSPGETFEDVNRKPDWIVPLLILILVGVAFTLFLTNYFAEGWNDFLRKAVQQRAAQSGQQATEEDIATAAQFGRIISYVIAVVGGPIYYLLLSGVFMLGMMFIQAQTTFKKIFSVVLWSAAVTSLVQTIVMSASALTLNDEARREFTPTLIGSLTPSNLGAFLPSGTAPAIRAAAMAIDLFSIWFLILLVIGFAKIGGARSITTSSTRNMVFGLWVFGILLRAAWAALMG